MAATKGNPLSALRRCRLGCANANGLRRRFSASSVCLEPRGIPNFQPASSSELDSILARTRKTILVPGYLNTAQRKLIFKKKYASQLENDPVYASIGDEEVELQPIDVMKDIPSTWTMFSKALTLAKEPQDWLNMVKLLEGLHESGAKLQTAWLHKFIRRAAMNGQQHVVIDALKQVERTGLSLRDENTFRLVVLGIRSKAKQAKWKEDGLTKALSYAKITANLMENSLHCGSRVVQSNDLRIQPHLVGLLLELSATNSLQYDGSRLDVTLYAERTVASLARSGVIKPDAELNQHTTDEFIALWLPVWSGLDKAQKLLGASLPQADEAKQYKAEIGQMLDDALPKAEGRSSWIYGTEEWQSTRQ